MPRRIFNALLSGALGLTLVFCGPAPGPSGGSPPPGATPVGMVSRLDPIGFLLQYRDTLGINDSTALQLSRLKLRLLRRTGEIRLKMDTLVREGRVDREALMRGDSTAMSDSLRQATAALREQARMHIQAARDTAWAMLTERQRAKADSLEEWLRVNTRRGPGPSMGTQGSMGRP